MSRTGTGALGDYVIFVGLVLLHGSSGLYGISRTRTRAGVDCVVSIGLILGQ